MKTIILKFSSKAILLSTVTFIGLQCTPSDTDEANEHLNTTERTTDTDKIPPPPDTTEELLNKDDTDDTDDTNDTDEIDTPLRAKDPIFNYSNFKPDSNAKKTLIITMHGLVVGANPLRDFDSNIIPKLKQLGYTCFNTESRLKANPNVDFFNDPIPDTHSLSIDKQADLVYQEILNKKSEWINNIPELENLCFVGHSLGGVVGKTVINKYGSKIEKLFNCKIRGVTISSPMKGVEYNEPTIQELLRTEEEEVRTIIIPILSPRHSKLPGIKDLQSKSRKKDNVKSKNPFLYIKNSCSEEYGIPLITGMGIKKLKDKDLFKALHNNEENDGLVPMSSMVLNNDTNSARSKSQEYEIKNCNHTDVLTIHAEKIAETISMFIQKQNKT